jgi:glycosyltransferase involved in cell wall biosynthesis
MHAGQPSGLRDKISPVAANGISVRALSPTLGSGSEQALLEQPRLPLHSGPSPMSRLPRGGNASKVGALTSPASIVAFAKDWNEDPTSNHHVLRELARSRRVLWLNSVATRTPKLSSSRDLGRVVRKLGAFAQGPVNVEHDLWVFTPIVLPLPHSAIARKVNRRILQATIGSLRARLGLSEFHLWTFLPNVADYVGAFGESLTVYYCVDEWSMFSYIESEPMAAAERRLLERADCVFAVTHALADRKRAANPNTHVSPHGVDHALFAQALAPETRVPVDVVALPRPVIGFYGTIQDWVDLDLVAYLARSHPEWSLVLVGQIMVDTSTVAGLPNVHLLGRREHRDLPAYCKGFDVGLIPYRVDERMPFVNPIKLREYLSAGLPVVSTDVPEVRRYEHWCAVADDHEGFRAAVERALAENSLELRQERSRAMESETWRARVAEIERLVAEVAARKRGRT